MEAAAFINRGAGTTEVSRQEGATHTRRTKPPTKDTQGYIHESQPCKGGRARAKKSTAQVPEAPWVGAVGLTVRKPPQALGGFMSEPLSV